MGRELTKVRDTSKIGVALFKMVDQATRGRNKNLHTGFQFADLRVLLDSTVNDSILDLGRGSELYAFLANLHGQLTGRRQHKNDRTITRLQIRLKGTRSDYHG